MSDHRRQPTAPQVGRSASTAYASRHKATAHDDAAVLTHWLTADITASVRLLRQVRMRPDYFGAHLSPLVVLAYAGVESFQRVPFIDPGNASVNLGVVTMTERGVQSPRVEQAQSLSLRQLAAALAEAVQRADEYPVAAVPSPLVIADVAAGLNDPSRFFLG